MIEGSREELLYLLQRATVEVGLVWVEEIGMAYKRSTATLAAGRVVLHEWPNDQLRLEVYGAGQPLPSEGIEKDGVVDAYLENLRQAVNVAHRRCENDRARIAAQLREQLDP